MSTANKMRSNGEDMKEVTIVEKILRTLTEKFNYVVVSIEESKDIDQLTVDELQSSLTVHEQKFTRTSGEEHALKVSSDNSTNTKGKGKGRGRGRGEGQGRGRGRQNNNRATIECFNCHKLGHYQYECPTWDKQANYAEEEEEDKILLMCSIETSHAQKDEGWFLDSGCSNRMCGNKSKFCGMDETFRHSVKLGNNTKMNVLGKGNVKLDINGVIHVIQDVFFVPDLKNNLLSIGQLQEKGLTIMFQSGMCSIYHPHKGLILQTNMTSNRMFILDVRTLEKKEICFNTTIQDLPHLWHCRYAHLSHKGLQTLQK